MSCACKKYIGKSQSALRASEDYSEVISNLEEIAREPGATFSLSVWKCKVCGIFWGTLFENFGASTVEYFFPIEDVDPEQWINGQRAKRKEDFEEARENRNIIDFKEFLNLPRVHEKCRNSECNRDRMKLSVFCPLHHWENSSGPLPDYLSDTRKAPRKACSHL